jgi:hypothetical protein
MDEFDDVVHRGAQHMLVEMQLSGVFQEITAVSLCFC